jgi:ElaB/YqjD/DUF883 family membrane-anchored ribosome-binding protein
MAIAASEPSVSELRRDAELSRSALTGTVDELRNQVNDTASHIREAVAPSTIKRQVKEYVRESGESMMESVQRSARENPLQAVAIGAGLAYPIFNLLRAIPAPLLLIGAGLALSRSTAVRQATDEAMERAREGLAQASDMARNSMNEARDTAQSVMNEAGDLVGGVKRQAGDLASSVKRQASDLLSGAKEQVTAVQDQLGRKAWSATGTARAGVEGASQGLSAAGGTIAEMASRATGTVSDMATRTQRAVVDTYNQNPLLITGIGLAVGALIASSLPTTSAENRVFGTTSEKLRRRAAEAAAEGLDVAKEFADDVVEAAGRQGLSANGLAAAAGEMTQKAKSVAERVAKTALGDTPVNPNPIPTPRTP